MGAQLLTQLAILQAWIKLLAAQSPNEQFKAGSGDCKRSTYGCECLPNYEIDGQKHNGCINSSWGRSELSWCEVDKSCETGHRRLMNNNQTKFMAFCNPQCTTTVQTHQGVQTIMGCECKDIWEYNGRIFEECANPNDDPVGSWCIVEPNSCPFVYSLLKFVNRNFGMPQEADHCVQSSQPALPYPRNDFGLNTSTLQFYYPISSYTIVSTSDTSSPPPPLSLNTTLFNFQNPTPIPEAVPAPSPGPTPTPPPSTVISQVSPISYPEDVARAPTFDFLMSAPPPYDAGYYEEQQTDFFITSASMQYEEPQMAQQISYTQEEIVQDVQHTYIDGIFLPQQEMGCVDLNTVLNSTKEFSTFNNVIVETGYSKIVEALQNQSVFISTNSAWDRFADVQSIDIGDFFLFQSNVNALKEIAQLHFIDEILDLEDMLDADQISVSSQLDNQNITFSSDGSKVQLMSPNSYSDPALVLDISPVEVCQGFYYIINNVLTPKIML